VLVRSRFGHGWPSRSTFGRVGVDASRWVIGVVGACRNPAHGVPTAYCAGVPFEPEEAAYLGELEVELRRVEEWPGVIRWVGWWS